MNKQKMIPHTPLAKAIDLLQKGGVGVMATDTVYGLVASAHNAQAVARLYALKARDHKPGTIIAASPEQLVALGIEQPHLERAGKWWPNAVSVVVPAGKELTYLHQGLDSLALRVPNHAAFQEVLAQTGPLLSSSANQPGQPLAQDIQQAWDYFKHHVDFYVDGGRLDDHAPSTIIRLTPTGFDLLRQGAVNIEAARGL